MNEELPHPGSSSHFSRKLKKYFAVIGEISGTLNKIYKTIIFR